MKDNENLDKALMYVDALSNIMVEHVVHQMQSEFVLSLVVSCLLNFQVKNYSCGSQGTYVERSYTQLLCSNQMINNVIKKINEDVNQDVPENMCDMWMTEFQTQRRMGKLPLLRLKWIESLFK